MRFKIPLALAFAAALVMSGFGSAFAGPRVGGWAGQSMGAGGIYAGSVAGTVTAIGSGTVTVASGQGWQQDSNLPAGTYTLSSWVKVVVPGEGAHGSVSQVQVGDYVRLVVGPGGLVDMILLHPHQTVGGAGGGTLTAPTNVTAAEAATGISLAWTAVAGATGYQVLESTGSGYTAVGVTSGGTPTTSSTTVTGLETGTTYAFEVEAVASGTTSSASAASNAVEYGASSGTASLADVTYSSGVWCGTVTITYNKPLDAASLDETLSDYTVVSNGRTSHPTSVSVSGGEVLLGEDICIGGGALDTVQVTTGQSAVNDMAGAPTTPINATSTLGNGSAVLAWESPTGVSLNWGAVAGASGYQVLVSSGSGYTPVAAANGGAPTTSSTTVTGLAAGTTYTFEVESVASGAASSPSQPSNAVEWGTKASPWVTTGLTQSGSQDTLTFTVAYDQDLSAASVDHTLSDYTVTDLTTGSTITVSAVSVSGNTVVLEATGVPSGAVSPTDLIRVGSAASVVNDADGAPSTQISATGML